LHVEWTGKKIRAHPELNDEIRIAKQFCKANNVYGAESYINGFSGHIVDILVIHYGSFISLMKKFASIDEVSIKKPLVIDTDNLLKNPIMEMNKSKISPLIIVDPVQPERNAAAALGKEKLLMFIDACKNFIDSPSEDLFDIKKFDLQKKILELKDKNKNSKIILIKVKTLEGSKDIVGTKVFKVYEDLIKQSSLNDFPVLDSAWHFDHEKRSAIILYVFDKERLSDTVEHSGPPLSAKADVEKFRNKHDMTKVKGNRIYATIKRKYTLPEKLLRELFEEKYIFDRVSEISIDKVL
jgi:tRNA nucleotidyltransferase (CCA-adding enzyme)